MTHPLVRRVLGALITVWAVLTLTFFVHHALPSDPARMMAGPQARPGDVERVREQLGLDRSLWLQYASYFRRLVHLGVGEQPQVEHKSCVGFWPLHVDLGMSFQRRKPVAKILATRLPPTLLLAFSALLVQIGLGTAAGVVASLRRGRLLDHGTIGVTLLGVSAPTFLTGLLVQYWFAYRIPLFPFDGYGHTTSEHLASLVLPTLTLGAFGAAFYARVMRDEMLTVLDQDFIRAASAKGLTRSRVVIVHGLRNALLPLVTLVGADLGTMVGGAIITEKLFRWPGIGALTVDAVLARDGPVVMGIVLLTTVAVVFANLVVDMVYVVLDPRVRRLPAKA